MQDGEDELHIPQRTHLSFQHIDSHGAYILDTSEYIYIYIGKAISDHFVQSVFNVPTFSALPLDSVRSREESMFFTSFILVYPPRIRESIVDENSQFPFVLNSKSSAWRGYSYNEVAIPLSA